MPNSVNQDWFKARLEERQMSMRALAKHMGMDVSSLSRMFAGTRKMQMEEAKTIAAFLHQPVAEVMRHAGVPVEPDRPKPGITLAATIGPDGRLTFLNDPKPLPQSVIDQARAAMIQDCSGIVIAAQVRAPAGGMAAWDDVIVLYCPSETVEADAIGSLAIVTDADGRQEMVKILRARKTGEAEVQTMDGETRSILIENAAPVIAVIP